MSRKTVITLSVIGVVFVLVVVLVATTLYYNDLPNRISQHETIVLGQNQLVPGSSTAMRVVVRDSKDASPLADASIEVIMKPESGGKGVVLFNGVTNDKGTADVTFDVPADVDPNQVLIINTKSTLGSDSVERFVKLERDFRILLTTDKPLYQPGQIIHIRALALSTFDLHPASDQELEIIIADGKGNKVFRESVQTTDFGVAFVDFQLANEVNTGPYKISAVLGNASSEKTVTVEHYVLPKFNLEIETDRPYYQPGDRVSATLTAEYFYGKIVDGGEVSIEGFTFDFERVVTFTLSGLTGENGEYEFIFDLPDYIAGSDLEGGLGRFYLQASVTDLAEHTETSNLSLPVAQNALIIEAMPEGGQFRTGVENILYILTSYPNGAPAQANLNIEFYNSGDRSQAQTGEYGLTEIRLTPDSPWQQFVITASDAMGNFGSREFYFEGQYSEETVLLRPDKPIYQVGETMQLTVLTSLPTGTAYVDIVREGQTISTRSVEIENGRATFNVDLSPDMYGTLEIHAYKILSWGGITRDTRLVVVDSADELSLDLTTDQEVYRPGDEAVLNIWVHDENQGTQAAIGLAIVDESVFALAEQDPGFAKLYFMLEQELLEPKYDLHGFSVPDLLGDVPFEDPDFEEAIEGAARASLAAVGMPTDAAVFSIQANSHEDAIRNVQDRQMRFYTNMSKGVFATVMLIPLVVLGVSVYAVLKEKLLLRSSLLTLIVAIFPLVIFLMWPLGDAYTWVSGPIDRLNVLFDWMSWSGAPLLLCLGGVALLGYITLIITAIIRKDPTLGWTLGAVPIFASVLILLAYMSSRSNVSPSESILIWALIGYSAFPLAYLLRASGFLWGRKPVPAFAGLFVSVFLLFGLLPTIAVGSFTGQMLGRGMVMNEVMLEAPAAMEVMEFAADAAMPVEMEAEKVIGEGGAASPAEPPRLRQYFPETMLWIPDAITDESGALQIDIPVADSITTWRMTALASSQNGKLGSTSAPLLVFQDFFIDLDLPLALTVGDEISVPVGVFNYLPTAQDVRLELELADWFELLDEQEKVIQIGGNDISVVYFRIRAVDFGSMPFKVTAWGSQMSDAILKHVRVYPNGRQINHTSSDRLEPGTPVLENVSIPVDAIVGTQNLFVKIYPGVVSQIVEGLDSILRMPFGCFEQTSSTTYPNVLVMDYLQTTGQVSPEVQFKAEEYINLGYQRLTTFEVAGSGGFSLFGDAPADRMLTAYGLQEFTDMSRVHNVDQDFINRAAEWLFSQQASDGSWENDRGLVHEDTWSSLGDDRLPVTAYITWSLVDAGFGADSRIEPGIDYVREFSSGVSDAYVLALVANALVAADLDSENQLASSTMSVLDRLAGMAIWEGSSVTWVSDVATFMGSEGQTGSIETTALAALAFLRANTHPELANAALTALIRQKDSFGTWYNTQATVLTLKALLQSIRAGAENINAVATITLNGGQTKTVEVNQSNFDVVQMFSFDDINIGRDNVIEINVEGEGNLMYQVVGNYYLPWEKLIDYPELHPIGELVTIDVNYDRTELAVEDTVEVTVTLTLNQPGGKAESALIDLGLPPGFSVQTEDLIALVARFDDVPEDYQYATIERFELTGRQILIYISNLTADNPLTFTYRLRAKFPLRAQTPSSSAYDYYNPDVNGEEVPQMLVVVP